jgi:hypothetical protein
MSHLSSIGFPVNTEQDFQSLANKLYERGERIKATNGFYIRFADNSGAELYLQENQNKEIIGMNPHFRGKGKMKVCLTNAVKRGGSEMDGAFHGWADPTEDNNPDTGIYPFVFDVPDFYSLENIKFPFTTTVQISAFAHELSLYENEQDFNAKQNEKMKFAPESFIPSGLFSPGGQTTEPPEANGIFTGRILEVEEKMNVFTKEKFYWFLVKTLGGEFDVVSDIKLISQPPKVGGIASGSFWLSGRLVS